MLVGNISIDKRKELNKLCLPSVLHRAQVNVVVVALLEAWRAYVAPWQPTMRLFTLQSTLLHQMCSSGANHSGLLRRHIMTVLQYSFDTRRLRTLRRDFYLLLPWGHAGN